jgi:predicted double-glycine peptidase
MLSACSHAAESERGIPIGGPLPGSAAIFTQVVSYRDQRFNHVVRQQTDFSCGAAALTTLLKYAYGMDVTEREVFFGMYAVSDPAILQQRGFSLLDMKRYLDSIGMQGVGYRIKESELYRIKVPVIVLLNIGGYEHFVVMRKALPTGVYVADPALGNRQIALSSFMHDWQFQVIFAVISPGYDPDNPLLVTEKPMSANQQARELLPAFNPLTQHILSTIAVNPGARL